MANRDLNPQNGLQGSSYLYRMGTSPNSRTVTSQKVRILAPAYGNESSELLQIGVMANFAPSESRTIETVRGLGFGDTVAELVPGNTEPMTANMERTLLYLSNLWQATGYAGGVSGPVRSLRHHRWPFDVIQQVVFSRLIDLDLDPSAPGTFAGSGFTGGVGSLAYPAAQAPNGTSEIAHTVLITCYEACWFSSWSTTFSRDSAIGSETGDVTISDVHDFGSAITESSLWTGNDPSLGQVGSIRFGGTYTPGALT